MKHLSLSAIMCLVIITVNGQKREYPDLKIIESSSTLNLTSMNQVIIQKPDNMRCLVPYFKSQMPCLKSTINSKMPVQTFPGLNTPVIQQKNENVNLLFKKEDKADKE